ncbi:aminotransferase [Purpureocillium lilacinum]|uniref:Aminotransferase n=1 Tax=Purpureocillium lilacinum TaxID=33203 RepID=A0A179H790_PURLI|nr:aminotransferase [Purpureocillium lilacinum]OAQ85460.1 aminotransferase [Purpureocillium lilacinum]
MKMAVKYFAATGQPSRTHFIARRGGFHGTTAGALALTGKAAFRHPFEPLLKSDTVSLVSMPNTYRGMLPGETEPQYVARLAKELDDEFRRVGPRRVCATGVLVPPAGYLRAVRRICDDHGALLILDEVMCGMGRTGTNYYHAWQAEGADAPPDIQTVAKGVSGGYAPVAMVLASQAVVDGINHASGIWNHGHTFTSHPVSCAAALAVQTVIKRENLVRYAAEMGSLLGAQLRGALGHHPHVGDIRGRGLLWAVEFVADRTTKRPFEPEDGIAARIHAVGMSDIPLSWHRHGRRLQGGSHPHRAGVYHHDGGGRRYCQTDHRRRLPSPRINSTPLML